MVSAVDLTFPQKKLFNLNKPDLQQQCLVENALRE